MTTLEAIILGLIQGLTEFFPISSSTHLQIVQKLLGMQNLQNYVLFDLVCHLGTLMAVIIVFWPIIMDILFKDKTSFFQLIIGTLPLTPLIFLIKPIKALFDDPHCLGFFMLFNALFLGLSLTFSRPKSEEFIKNHRWRDPFLIGIMQAFAVLPGISRSGSTISTAWFLGWGYKKALVFSFLLSIPAILGGTLYEMTKVLFLSESVFQVGLIHYIEGFISSLIVGWGALLFLLKMITQDQFKYFAWYCLFLGIVLIWYFNF